MEIVTVSSKYQIVIPRSLREPMGIKPGSQVVLMRLQGSIHIVPLRPIEEMRGFIKGISSHIEREPDREL